MTRATSIRLVSTVHALRQLVLHPLPTKVVDVAIMVRTERVTVAVSHAGKIYTSQVDKRGGYVSGQPLAHTIACLKKLGILTASAITEHETLTEQKNAAARRKWAAQSILRESIDAGLKLSPKQRARLVEQATQ